MVFHFPGIDRISLFYMKNFRNGLQGGRQCVRPGNQDRLNVRWGNKCQKLTIMVTFETTRAIYQNNLSH